MKGAKLLNLILITFSLYSNSFGKLDKTWWKHTLMYEIITFSFKDSDGDGIGDIKGVTSKMDHFEDLGIETIHFTPPYKTELRDMGFDITDYYDIEPRFGTMADFDELMSEMKKRNMKLILDLVINHSSDKSEWFKKSVDRIDPYTDYYVWKDSKGIDNDTGEQIPPNNWVEFFSTVPGSGWTWNEKRKQFYFHQFLPEQADLNLRNPIVKKEMEKLLKFWLDKGVAGFRVDAVRAFMEDEQFRDNTNYQYMQMDEEGTMEYVKELRAFLDNYNRQHGGIERIFLPEVHDSMEGVRKFYDNEFSHITQMPYTYYLRYIESEFSAEDINQLITTWLKDLPKHAASAWVTEDHDGDRISSRLRPEYVDILMTISMLLPGAVEVLYGLEIGMTDGYIRENQIRDILGKGSRDPGRLVMQWDNTMNAGFSENITTFLPVNSDYYLKNVEAQKKQRVSHYNLFKKLSKLRRTDVLKYGSFHSYVPSKYLYIFTRSFKRRMYIVIINLGVQLLEVKLDEVIGMLPDKISVVAASVNARNQKGYKLDLQFKMNPLSLIVLEGYDSKDF